MNLIIRHVTRLLVICPALFVTTSALGFEMGPLNYFLEQGSSPGWDLSDEQGAAVLSNPSLAGDITYYYVNEENDGGQRTVSVKTNVVSRDGGRAGLIYGILQNPRSYFLFTSDGLGDAGLHFFGPDGFEHIVSHQIARGKATLTIEERGNEIALYANDTELQVISSDRFGKGGVGIVATNIGRFQLSDFELTRSTNPLPGDKRPGDNNNGFAQNNTSAAGACTAGMQYMDRVDKQSGMVMTQSPMPSGWNFAPENTEQLFITGPDVSVYSYNTGSFVWGKTQQAMETAYQQNVRRVAEPVSIKQYLDLQITPSMQNYGFRLISSEELPRIQSFWEIFSMSMPDLGGSRKYEVIGTEWEHQDGSRLYKLLVLTLIDRQQAVVWDVQAGDLYASKDSFKHARDTYLCSYAETRINPDWQIRKNEELVRSITKSKNYSDRLMAQSAAAHAQRMNAIAKRGENTKSIGDTYSDILDINQSGYLKRSDMVSSGQAKFADYASGNTIIFSPETGERFKVESGNRHYWINNFGEYFGTDNPNLDPRTDSRFNNATWTSTNVVR